MNYDLCKKLKDAGFPQDGEHYFCRNKGEEWSVWNMCETSEFSFTGFEQSYCAPTLAELIEALGDETVRIDKYSSRTMLNINDTELCFAGCNGFIGKGKTPEESVACLWLAIHSQELKDSKDMID